MIKENSELLLKIELVASISLILLRSGLFLRSALNASLYGGYFKAGALIVHLTKAGKTAFLGLGLLGPGMIGLSFTTAL